jgi:hypothetical protein
MGIGMVYGFQFWFDLWVEEKFWLAVQARYNRGFVMNVNVPTDARLSFGQRGRAG